MAFSLEDYFARIGYEGTPQADVETLGTLQAHHIASIAFENLDVLLDREIHLDDGAVFEKLVTARRGGYCFEQNGLLERVLRELRFNVRSLAARVLIARPDQVPPRTHRLLCVAVHGEEWLVDVGFGSQTLPQPMRFLPGEEVITPSGIYRLDADHDDFILNLFQNNVWQPLYRFDTEDQYAADFLMANHFIAHWPDSHFRQHILMSRHLPDGGKVTLNNFRFTHYGRDGVTIHEEDLTPDRLADVLETEFLLGLTHPQHGLTPATLHKLGRFA
ncbi:arylamine N-acetyltransferase [Siccibacter turicensis]|uniref:N-hydroxyarylamine O-acetyltransferase n=1 Tax=Siccibacter turicensis TaxID=357233 RepID=A0A2P8VMZ6_9ENTR|nr:arylamine N-acetyltransferase [Siccibacter turicensis]PSN08428.1 N-hydroxyarylamine O-acetyltransferase [Siccibacter turicensis]